MPLASPIYGQGVLEKEIIELPISELLPTEIPGDIHYDDYGFLWISAGRRVFRFDGYRLLLMHEGNENELAASVETGNRAFLETPGGAFWFLPSSGHLLKFDPHNRSFAAALSSADQKALLGERIQAISYDNAYGLWMALDNGDIAAFDLRDKKLSVIETSPLIGEGDFFTSSTSSQPGEVWVLSAKGVLLLCEHGRRTCTQTNLREFRVDAGIEFEGLTSIQSRSSLVISTHGHGLFEFKPDTHGLRSLPVPDSESKNGTFFGHVWDVHVTQDGDLWVATMAGLYGIKSNFGETFNPTTSTAESKKIALQFEEIDHANVLINFPGEVSLIREKRFEAFGVESGLVSPTATAFSQVSDSSIFVSSVHGLSEFDPRSSQSTPISIAYPKAQLIDSRIMTLHADNGGLWFGGFSGGLRYLDLRTGFTERFIKNVTQADAITQILELEANRLLLGTAGDGLILASKTGGETAHIRVNPQAASLENFVLSLAKARDGSIIVGSVNGLVILPAEPDHNTVNVAKASKHLENKEIYDVVQTSDGFIWVGTFQNGLYRSQERVNTSVQSFSKIETSPQLPDDTIYSIEEDDFGMLWLSTIKGLVRLDPSNNNITIYNESDGLVDDEFNAGASMKDTEGLLYFGGNNGFTRFNPGHFAERREPPPLRLTEVLIHRKRVPFDPAYVAIPELVLTHNDHSLDFEFSTMDIISPGRSRYKYRLNGFDDDWVDIGTRNSATFTSLPAGEYLLRVIGADSKGVWNYDGISLPIRVLPAPWLTWWAFTLYGVAILGFMMLLKRFYDTHLLKEKATQEARDMTITATLVMDDLQDQLETENRLVDNLRKHSASSYEMVDEFLTLELEELYGAEIDEPLGRARQRLHCLKALESSVYFHLDLIKVNFRDAVDRAFAEVIKSNPHPAAELVLANDCSESLVSVDVAAPLLLLAHELLLNSVLHAFPDSEGIECIVVNFQLEGDRWVFELSDSGCGLPAAIDPTRPATLGMELVARVVSRLGATIEVSRVGGTQYRVTVPDPAFAPA